MAVVNSTQTIHRDPMAWIYILRCADGSYYVGSTIDLDRRLSQHQLGEGAKYTQRRRPVELAWCHEFASIKAAYGFEKQVQGWSRAKREALMDGRLDALPDLAWGFSAKRTGERGPRRWSRRAR